MSLTGSDADPGTLARPFRTIARGISVVQAGDVLSLRGGVYVESVRIAGKHGTPLRPIIIRSYPGERAVIDGSLPQFRALNNDDWELATGDSDDVVPPHSDEYVSKIRVTGFVRGAFLDRQPYTRLITYSTLEDLRATNETFDTISARDPRPGPQVVDCNDDGSHCLPATSRYPWVYMGPGIWVDRSVSPETPQPIHIRLSHTHNNVPGLADYRGKTIRVSSGSQSPLNLCRRCALRMRVISVSRTWTFGTEAMSRRLSRLPPDWCLIMSASQLPPTAYARETISISRSSTATSTGESRVGISGTTAKRSTGS